MKIYLFLLTLFLSFTLPTIAQTTPETLLQQGKAAYDRAEYSTAITTLQQAEQLFKSKQENILTSPLISIISIGGTIGALASAILPIAGKIGRAHV